MGLVAGPLSSEKGHARGRVGGHTVDTESPRFGDGGSLRLGSVTLRQSRFDPGLDFGLEPPDSCRPVGAEPYPLGELASLFETVDVGEAVEDEIPDLFLREQAEVCSHREHSGWGASRCPRG